MQSYLLINFLSATSISSRANSPLHLSPRISRFLEDRVGSYNSTSYGHVLDVLQSYTQKNPYPINPVCTKSRSRSSLICNFPGPRRLLNDRLLRRKGSDGKVLGKAHDSDVSSTELEFLGEVTGRPVPYENKRGEQVYLRAILDVDQAGSQAPPARTIG